MIVRVFRARIRAGKLDEWEKNVQRLSIPLVSAAEGMLAYYPGKPVDPETREFSMVTIWRDLEAVRAFTGGEWNRVVIPDEEQPLVEKAWVHHYETFGGSPSERR